MPCCAGSTATAGTASILGFTSTVRATSTDCPGHSTSSAFSAITLAPIVPVVRST